MQLGQHSPGCSEESRRRSSPLPPDVQIHPLLRGLASVWDISMDPATARQIKPCGTLEPIPSDLLDSPATEPGVCRMKIVCDLFPWCISITVERDEVAVGMVMGAIFHVLQELPRPEDSLEGAYHHRRKMHRAMARLARGSPDFELDSPLKKIDWLGGKTEFLGLEPLGPAHAPEEWLLKLGSP